MLTLFKRLAIAAALSALFGCSNYIHYTVQPAEPISEEECATPAPRKYPDQFVGVGLSGGGSRASVFSAATLEALWEQGLGDMITHVSSVSGGSLAGTYFSANYPSCDLLPTPAEQNACWKDFFTDYKEAMRYKFYGSMKKSQILKFRLYSASRLANSLKETLDKNYLNGMTFADLAERDAALVEQGIYPPVMLVNATSYDDGRRIIFSNQCLSDNIAPIDDDIVGNPLTLDTTRSLPLMPANCTQPTEQNIPLSLAATSSAAFPGFVGPITYRMPLTCEGEGLEWWHIGDGGLSDNAGVNTLEEVLLREHRLEPRTLKRAMFLEVESSVTKDPAELRQIEDFWVLTYHATEVAAALRQRGDGYHKLFWKQFEGDLKEDGLPLEKLSFAVMDAVIDEWPASCPQQAKSVNQSTEDIRADISVELSKIPTHYKVSECHADLLEVAAQNVVRAKLTPEMMERLKSMGFTVRTAPVAR